MSQPAPTLRRLPAGTCWDKQRLALLVGLSRQAVYRIKDDPAVAEAALAARGRRPRVPGNMSPAAAAVDTNRRPVDHDRPRVWIKVGNPASVSVERERSENQNG
jgi:hypothetical protein